MERSCQRQRWLSRPQEVPKGIRKYVIVHGKIVKDMSSRSGSVSSTRKHFSADQSDLKQLTLKGFMKKTKEDHKRRSTVPQKKTLSTSLVATPSVLSNGLVPASVLTRGVRKKASSAVVDNLHGTGHEDKENLWESGVPSDNSDDWQSSRSGCDTPFSNPIPDRLNGCRPERNRCSSSRASYRSPSNSCPKVDLTTAVLIGKHHITACYPSNHIAEESHRSCRNSRKHCALREKNPNVLNCGVNNPGSDSNTSCALRQGASNSNCVTNKLRTHSDSKIGKERLSSGTDRTSKCQDREPGKPDGEGYENTDELLADLSYYEKLII